MSSKQTACDPSLLSRLLDHQLDSKTASDVELHLSECSECRERMEQLAASPDFWQGVEERLKSPPSPNGAIHSVPSEAAPLDHQAATRLATTHSTDQDERLNNTLAIESYMQRWLAPTDDPESLGRLAGYEIVGIVGIGGMSVVLKGFDRSLNRYVAVKVLGTHLSSSGAARQRFSREAQAAAAIVHENVLAIHSIDEFNGLPYLVMPYVRGESLEKRLQRVGPFQLVEILRIGQQIAAGLSAAHEQGLVHRDIKPANILLDEGSERLKISDFGLARAAADASLTHSGSITGTPLYMSPEQARGEPVDQRSDLFSFGSLLYSLCTGHPPFRAETPYGIIRRICDDPARSIRQSNPDIPEWLEGIIQRMMAKRVEERFSNAAVLDELFKQALSYVQQPSTGEQLPEALRRCLAPVETAPTVDLRTATKQITIALLAAVAGILVLMFAVSQLWFSGQSKNEVATNPALGEFTASPVDPSPPSEENIRKTTKPNLDLPAKTAYRFQDQDEIFYQVQLQVEQPEYLFKLDCLLELAVKSVDNDAGELGYQLSYRRSIHPVNDLANPNELTEAMSREVQSLEDFATRGRIKVKSEGGVAGRSAVARLPGELGPLHDWVFPVVGPLVTKTGGTNTDASATTSRNWNHDYQVDARVYRPGESSLIGSFPIPSSIRSARRPERISMLRNHSVGSFPETMVMPPNPVRDQFFGNDSPVEYAEFNRVIQFATSSKDQTSPGRMQSVHFEAMDRHIQSSFFHVSDRTISGNYEFDTRTGLLQSLKLERKAANSQLASEFLDPVSKLEIRRIDAKQAQAFKDELHLLKNNG